MFEGRSPIQLGLTWSELNLAFAISTGLNRAHTYEKAEIQY